MIKKRVKLTKATLSGFIKWSSSRYNEYKKSEVVDLSYKALLQGSGECLLFHTDSYCGTDNYCDDLIGTMIMYMVNPVEKYIAEVDCDDPYALYVDPEEFEIVNKLEFEGVC